MGEILVLLGEIIGYILDAVGLLSTLQGILGNPAQQSNLLTTETLAGEGTTAVTDPISGTHAIWSLLGAVQTGSSPSLETITTLINGLTPTTLPPSPPPDWGGELANSLVDLIVTEPWWGPYEATRYVAQEWYDTATQLLGMTGATGWPDRHGPWFALTSYSPDIGWNLVKPWRIGGPILPPTVVEWTTWNGTDTLVEFLNGIDDSYGWDHNGPGGYETPGIVWGHITGEPEARWRCLVAEWQLPFVSGRAWEVLDAQQKRTPPLWPGLDGVTLGDPVALTDSAIITGPMDGVLLDITANKPGSGHFGTDGTQYTYRGGWLTFLDATGRAEEYQYLGWNSAFLLTKQMPRAGGVCVVLRDIAACTVTPFTLL